LPGTIVARSDRPGLMANAAILNDYTIEPDCE